MLLHCFFFPCLKTFRKRIISHYIYTHNQLILPNQNFLIVCRFTVKGVDIFATVAVAVFNAIKAFYFTSFLFRKIYGTHFFFLCFPLSLLSSFRKQEGKKETKQKCKKFKQKELEYKLSSPLAVDMIFTLLVRR